MRPHMLLPNTQKLYSLVVCISDQYAGPVSHDMRNRVQIHNVKYTGFNWYKSKLFASNHIPSWYVEICVYGVVAYTPGGNTIGYVLTSPC
jgi:hypothetical protein